MFPPFLERYVFYHITHGSERKSARMEHFYLKIASWYPRGKKKIRNFTAIVFKAHYFFFFFSNLVNIFIEPLGGGGGNPAEYELFLHKPWTVLIAFVKSCGASKG